MGLLDCHKRGSKLLPVMWVPQVMTAMIYDCNSEFNYGGKSRTTCTVVLNLLLWVKVILNYNGICTWSSLSIMCFALFYRKFAKTPICIYLSEIVLLGYWVFRIKKKLQQKNLLLLLSCLWAMLKSTHWFNPWARKF